MNRPAIFITGVTGLLGQRVVTGILRDRPDRDVVLLVRDAARWRRIAEGLRLPATRITVLDGDIRVPGLALDPHTLGEAGARVECVIHMAADVVFSRTLEEARSTNTGGTRNLLAATGKWPARFCYVSTAFAVGRRTGYVLEGDVGGDAGWVNAYEQSKWEAEQAVRESDRDYLILRPSTIVCDSVEGWISQMNAVHRSLRLIHAGLAPMIPGRPESPIDVVPADYVADSVAALSSRADLTGETLHLCAGRKAATLGELLDLSFLVWSEDAAWRRRGIAPPSLTELSTYRLFEKGVEETGDTQLRQIARSMSHFVPQLAHEKWFDTRQAEAAAGRSAPSVLDYWPAMIRGLERTQRDRIDPAVAA